MTAVVNYAGCDSIVSGIAPALTLRQRAWLGTDETGVAVRWERWIKQQVQRNILVLIFCFCVCVKWFIIKSFKKEVERKKNKEGRRKRERKKGKEEERRKTMKEGREGGRNKGRWPFMTCTPSLISKHLTESAPYSFPRAGPNILLVFGNIHLLLKRIINMTFQIKETSCSKVEPAGNFLNGWFFSFEIFKFQFP